VIAAVFPIRTFIPDVNAALSLVIAVAAVVARSRRMLRSNGPDLAKEILKARDATKCEIRVG
jgi:hypothetical protein